MRLWRRRIVKWQLWVVKLSLKLAFLRDSSPHALYAIQLCRRIFRWIHIFSFLLYTSTLYVFCVSHIQQRVVPNRCRWFHNFMTWRIFQFSWNIWLTLLIFMWYYSSFITYLKYHSTFPEELVSISFMEASHSAYICNTALSGLHCDCLQFYPRRVNSLGQR